MLKELRMFPDTPKESAAYVSPLLAALPASSSSGPASSSPKRPLELSQNTISQLPKRPLLTAHSGSSTPTTDSLGSSASLSASGPRGSPQLCVSCDLQRRLAPASDYTQLVSQGGMIPDRFGNLFDKSRHFIDVEVFDRDTPATTPYLGGMTAINNLLQNNIGAAILNPSLMHGIVARELSITGPVQCGLRSAVVRFAAGLRRYVCVIKYCAYGDKLEASSQFWNDMFDLAAFLKPCIVLVHRISARVRPEVANEILMWMASAWHTRQERPQTRQEPVWLVFADACHPERLIPERWTLNSEQTAVYVEPDATERREALLSTLTTWLQLRTDHDTTVQLLQNYSEYIEKYALAKDEQEVDLGGLARVWQFVARLFKISIARQTHLAIQAEEGHASIQMLPNEEDFVAACRSSPKRRVARMVVAGDGLSLHTNASGPGLGAGFLDGAMM